MNGRAMLTTAILAAGVFLFLLFYAANEPQRLARIVEEETRRLDEAAAERRAALLPRAEIAYQANCAECHGFDGEGGDQGPALRSKSYLDAASDEMLAEVIRAGRPGTDMRAWSKAHGGPLGDDEIDGLVAFLRAWQADAPAGADDPRAGARSPE